MPTVAIEMFEGRTHEQKQALVTRITDAVVDVLAVDPNLIKVKFYEIRRSNSAQGGVLGTDIPPSAT